MVTLGQVADHLKNTCGMTAKTVGDGEREVCQVELLGGHTVFQRDTLYF